MEVEEEGDVCIKSHLFLYLQTPCLLAFFLSVPVLGWHGGVHL